MVYSDAQMAVKLNTRRDSILDELAALTTTTAGGKPNASQTGVDHVGYKDGLYRELEFIDERLKKIAVTDGGTGGTEAWEVVVETQT